MLYINVVVIIFIITNIDVVLTESHLEVFFGNI